jgi:dihydrofolate synthase / folylpolyglutamate synthase
MKVKTIKTKPLRTGEATLIQFIERYVKDLPESSILVITSKVAALCEGRTVPVGAAVKEELVIQEAEYWLPPQGKYAMCLCIKEGRFIPMAGIDESNADGRYVLWPTQPYAAARSVWRHLRKRFGLKKVGVIITDSTTAPLRLGTAGISIGHAGFEPLRNYIGEPDIFGRKLKYTKVNHVDPLAAAAVVLMGDGNECTPLAIITSVPFVRFTSRPLSAADSQIPMKKDLYEPILSLIQWRKGGALRGH